jgi:hypothetical protein
MTKWLIPVILAAVLIVTPVTTQAQNEITLIDSSAQVYFPGGLAFNIEAASHYDITRIRLHYQTDRLTYAPVTDEAWPEFSPSQRVKAQWVWDMRKVRSPLPPGATVNYWWTIEDANGDILTTPSQEIRFDDLRFDWKNLTSGQITIHWYKGDQAFIDQLVDACQQALNKLASDTGVHLMQPVNIYIYASSDDLLSAMVFPQEWTGGVCEYEYGTILIGIPVNELEWGKGAITHELGHMVTHQITYSPYGAILPTWLDEGLAMYAQVNVDPYFKSTLNDAIAKNGLISVRSLSSPFSAIPQEAYLSYAESLSIVEFLIHNYGSDKMLQLLNLFKTGSSYDDAFKQVYGFDEDGLDTVWRAYVMGPVISQSKTNYDSLIESNREYSLWNNIFNEMVTAYKSLGG